MHIYKCGKVDYREGQIYSVDVHPSGKYLATAGSDGTNGLIAIWRFDFITNDDLKAKKSKKSSNVEASSHLLVSEDENSQVPTGTGDENAPIASTASQKPHQTTLEDKADRESENSTEMRLCQKLLLGATQNCVRWSRSHGARYLVSAGDNAVLRLYRLEVDEPTIGRQTKVELKDAYTLFGHTMEILHAEFSYCGRFLASCSLDASIIIWDMERLPSILVVLNTERGGHTDFVTGIAWDPVERFLASQSSDKTLKIWRCDTWQCEKTISGPFNLSSARTLFRRLSWSADGSLLVATCSTNNKFHTAKVIIRKGYDYRRDLVGFEDVVSCVRSSENCLLYKTVTGKEIVVSCMAVGSADRSLSIWLFPELSRPLCVIKNLFPGTILDMSWHENNLALIGIDGSLRCIRFEKEEIGTFFVEYGDGQSFAVLV
ncbi:Protein HIRA [Aphelenchoides besseyi]|nr:Protein HIRA [Aphelenchoides besseyi]